MNRYIEREEGGGRWRRVEEGGVCSLGASSHGVVDLVTSELSAPLFNPRGNMLDGGGGADWANRLCSPLGGPSNKPIDLQAH